ncbi:hypothetical protein HZH68_008848 [Vespula germanica]|uniref:Uncharacterized protein n=1 Tax=Vespula germanica TaxID=30212 RepID=A0A834K019_VESGE|nr:hypothetical protein HZH68_008848 [Vespula germanica]
MVSTGEKLWLGRRHSEIQRMYRCSVEVKSLETREHRLLLEPAKVPRKIATRYFPGTVSESQASSESNRGSSHTKAKFLASLLPKQTGVSHYNHKSHDTC